MVEIKEIVDGDSLRDWLVDQPEDMSVWIARRAAMRLLPFLWDWTAASQAARNRDLAVLPILRLYLISEVARNMPTSEITVGADRAAHAANGAALAADSSAGAAAITDTAARLVLAAARATDSAARAVRVADVSGDAAHVSGDAALAARVAALAAHVAADAVTGSWKVIRADCAAISAGVDLGRLRLWIDGENPMADIWGEVKATLSVADPPHTAKRVHGPVPVDWSFWIKWYDSVLAGEPLNGDMLEEIALIEPAEWEKGPARVNFLIGEIEQDFSNETNAPLDFQPANVSPAAKKEIVKRVQQNRETIALSIASVLEQISEFRERMRGINDMDPMYRESIFDYLDGLSEQLSELLGQLPDVDQVIDEPQADKLVTWGQKFKHSFTVKANNYIAPENVAGATLPTGIIISCTAIGSFFGPMGAGAGAVVGKLITGELKPAKAVEALIENDDLPSDD